MPDSIHCIRFGDSGDLSFLADESVALVVTSPPYPMIEMWDELFRGRVPGVADALSRSDGRTAFELMHEDLDRVWSEVFRVLMMGGLACINIGDATRKVGDVFRLYSNHSRILSECIRLGFDVLPLILWRKQTNAPNKFMGSGMLPAGAYVTLEHEYVLVLRKGSKRDFESPEAKIARRENAYFWEERNTWLSDIWDLKGTRQTLDNTDARSRSAAFPFELAYRLINMYSARTDTVLDPFLGTGTTMFAAMASGRNCVGVEIDSALLPVVHDGLATFSDTANAYIMARLQRHLDFCNRYQEQREPLKYTNVHHHFPVVTSQETDLRLEAVEAIVATNPLSFRVSYTQVEGGNRAIRVEGLRSLRAADQLSLSF